MTPPEPQTPNVPEDMGMVECDNCGGQFLREDMEADYCRDCSEELFGDDA